MEDSMAEALRTRLNSRLGWILFVYGAAFHIITFRVGLHFANEPSADRTFVDHPITNVGLTLLGGLITWILMSWVVLKPGGADFRSRMFGIISGGLAAMFATALALQAMILLISAYLGFHTHRIYPEVSVYTACLLALIDVETYGLFVIIGWAPISFVSGAIVAGVLQEFRHRSLLRAG
jgi:uncharacterized membrane protein AbrB (regulator of aidB expression)